jgi:hypothetical protein
LGIGDWGLGIGDWEGIYIDPKGEKYEGEWENGESKTCLIF